MPTFLMLPSLPTLPWMAPSGLAVHSNQTSVLVHPDGRHGRGAVPVAEASFAFWCTHCALLYLQIVSDIDLICALYVQIRSRIGFAHSPCGGLFRGVSFCSMSDFWLCLLSDAGTL
jgi:hypothetical protein